MTWATGDARMESVFFDEDLNPNRREPAIWPIQWVDMQHLRWTENRRPGTSLSATFLAAAISLSLCFAAQPAYSAQVYVQDSPAAAELLAAARDRIEKDELDEAARLIQQVFDEHGRKLLEREDGGYAEARRLAEGLLADHAALLDLYRQLHEPEAAAALDQAGASHEKLLGVIHRYALTESGLTAALRLAGLAMEAGQTETAAVILEQLADHPRRGAAEARWAKLTATAAILRGDVDQFHNARAQLVKLNRRDMINSLDTLAGHIERQPSEPTFSPLDTLPEAEPPSELARPLWSVPMGGAEQYLIDRFQIDQTQIASTAKGGRYLNIIPHLWRSTLFTNDGQVATALEPSSGRELWQQEVIDNDADSQAVPRPYNRWLPSGVDLSLLSVAENRVVGLFGFGSMAQQVYYYRDNTESQLVCLHADDGRVLWRLDPEQIDPDLDSGFWYGRPVLDGGRVYATLRRRQRTQFQDAYVVAIDLRNGELIWKRHLVSTALTDRNSLPALGHLMLRGGYLYVDSGLGAVAKLAAADGQIDWLTLVPVDEDRGSNTSYQPWSASSPVLVESGLIVLDSWMDLVRQFDPETGEIVDSFPASRWGSPIYLSRVGDDVLAIGSNVARFSGDSLVRRWLYRSEESILRGRAAVAGQRLYLPLGQSVQLIDLEKGKLVKKLPVQVPANLLALDGQLVSVDRQGINSYSSWQVAVEQLRGRAGKSPDDPRPWVALAWLSFNTQRRESLIESIDHALEIVTQRGPKARGASDLFDQLLAMAEQADVQDSELRSALFERLAMVTATPEQEVTYRLALARYLESQQQHEQAVSEYQTILADPVYRRQLYTHESGSRQAGLEAQRRVRQLIKQHGRDIYASFDAFAEHRLDELANQADAAALTELAESYPLSQAAGQALQRAAELIAEQGRTREAVALLRRAALTTEDDDQLAKIYGREAELFEKASQPHRARRVLRSLMAAHPGVDPIQDGRAVDPALWIEQLNAQASARGLMAQLDMPLTGRGNLLNGQLMTAMQQDPDASPPAVFLLRLPQAIQLRRASDLSIVWTRPLETNEAVELLSMDRHHLWLMYPASLRLKKLSLEDGQMVWDQDTLADKLGDIKASDAQGERTPQEVHVRRVIGAGRVIVQMRMRKQQGGEGADDPARPMVALSDLGISLVDSRGRVIVVNAETGKVRWQAATIVRYADVVKMDSNYLMIAGSDEDDAPLLCVYEAGTGQLLHRLIKPPRQKVTWMDATDDGLLLYVSDMQVEAFDLYRGQSKWLSEPGVKLVGEDGAWLNGRQLVLASQEGDMLWMDVADGRVTHRMPVRDMLDQGYEVTADPNGWIMRGDKTCLSIDVETQLRWRDALSQPHRLIDHVLTDRYVVLLSSPAQGQFADPGNRVLYVLDRQTGKLIHEHEVAGAAAFDQLRVLDGRLLLSADDVTAVISSAP